MGVVQKCRRFSRFAKTRQVFCSFSIVTLVGLLGASPDRIQVVAMVGDRALTTRQLHLELVLESQKLGPFSEAEKRSAIERLVLQEMVAEENRLTGLPQPDAKRIQAELLKTQRGLGKSWASFVSRFGWRDSEWNQSIAKRLAVEDALLLRVQASRSTGPVSDVLRDWNDQLRTRYRVRMLEWESAASGF
jgi:hypothetical protein